MSAPSVQEAVEKALDQANREIFSLTGAGVATMAAVSAALRVLIRDVQVSALESVAKEMCHMCKHPETYPVAAFTTIERGGKRVERWRHVEGEDQYLCDAQEPWDMAARLRSGEEPGGER